MKNEFEELHLRHLKGVLSPEFFQDKAEIIPNEPGRVMLPRDCAKRILEFLCFY